MANNTYTYVGSEIRPITGIEDKILSAKYIYDAEYIKYNQDLSIRNLHDIFLDLRYIIDNLRGRIVALEESNVTKEYDLTVSLTGCSSTTLKNGKISENGGTYTVTADTHYNLPSSITVKQGSTTLTAGIHYIWSNGTLRILQGITGAISVTITAIAKSYSITVSGNASSTQKSITYTTSNVQVTLTPNTGYTITDATILSGATFVSFSNNVVTFNKIIGNITITAQTSEIVLTAVSVSKSTGTGTLSSDTVSLTGKGSSITLLLNSTPDTALNKTMSLAATNSGGATTNVLGLNTSTVSDGNTVKLTPTSAISGAKLKISNNKSTVLKTLTVNVADGSTTAIIVKNSSGTTSSSFGASGGEVALTATVTSTKFNVGTVNWTVTGGGSFNVTTGNSVTFTAPANTSETAAATYEITATCDGKSATYSVTVAKKPVSIKYYWYVGNGDEIAKNDPAAGDIDWSKAQQITSFESLGYSANGTKITMNKTGENNVYILCPKSWSNKWQFWNVDNTIDLTTGFSEVSELLGISSFTKDGVEYDLWMAEGYAGNIAHMRSK